MGSLTHLCDDTRSDWDARSPLGPLRPIRLSRRSEFFNHYIGNGSPDFAHRPHSACLEQVRRWQKDHQTKRPEDGGPWKDIGYNALVCGHARLIEGRGLEVRGSHCPDHNRIGFGIQFMVAGSERPTEAMFRRMRRLYDDLVELTGGPLAKRGHRDGTSTRCPGAKVYGWVLDGMPATTTSATAGIAGLAPTEEDDVTPQDKKDIIDGVWAALLARPGNTPVPASSHVGNANVLAFRANKRLAGLEAKVLALTAAVEALAAAGPSGPADVGVIVDNAVRDRLNTFPVNGDDDSFDLDRSDEDDL
ncbi:peptidoglycan recognition family protein [Oryzobacter terrae]|uniref:peptidoglycan recognition protein family protein n=1 Tax=Oryzobacter terrae TaxID=1620385 RepID=UPI00366DC95D